MKYTEPASPCEFKDFNGAGNIVPIEQYYGMTLRDYFAAHASKEDIEEVQQIRMTRAQARYICADRMLIARGE
jgi:hypothetical protein